MTDDLQAEVVALEEHVLPELEKLMELRMRLAAARLLPASRYPW